MLREPRLRTSSTFRPNNHTHGFTNGYRSGLEEKIAEQLRTLGLPVRYEPFKIEYEVPTAKHKYTPDYVLENGIVIESKGLFTSADRKKHLLIQKQSPIWDIRFVFQRPNARLSKKSPTTYAAWADTHGFRYAKGLIPQEWIDEPAP